MICVATDEHQIIDAGIFLPISYNLIISKMMHNKNDAHSTCKLPSPK